MSAYESKYSLTKYPAVQNESKTKPHTYTEKAFKSRKQEEKHRQKRH